jgi:hypothetical protein
MAVIDELLKRNLLLGIAVGVGATVLAPVLMPTLVKVGRPMAKAAIKNGMSFYLKARETLAEWSEIVDDVAAEAKAELAEELRTHAAAAETATETTATAAAAGGNGGGRAAPGG